MKNNQKGFGAIEVLLVLILISILGFTGYYVWHSRNTANNTYNNSSKTASSTSNPLKSKWQTYKGKVSDEAQNPAVQADQVAYSFEYPAEWTFFPIGTKTTANGQTATNSFQEVGPSLDSDQNLNFNSVASSKSAKDYYTDSVGDQSRLVGPIYQGVEGFTTQKGYSGYTSKLEASTGTIYGTDISNGKGGVVTFNYGAALATNKSILQHIFDSVTIPQAYR